MRAEDYAMNGPRLLSRGGVRVENDDVDGGGRRENGDRDPANDADNDPAPSSTSTSTSSSTCDAVERHTSTSTSKSIGASIPITRYLWDDDGGDVARIHIDVLPSFTSSTDATTMRWEDAGVTADDVEVRLIGGGGGGIDDYGTARRGLYVGVVVDASSPSSSGGGTTRGGGTDGGSSSNAGRRRRRCHLHVAKMYGDAESVRFVVKRRKLLIKITKRRVPKRRGGETGRGKAIRRGGGHDDVGAWGRISRSIVGMLFGSNGAADDDDQLVPLHWPRLSAAGGGASDATAVVLDDDVLFGET